jgi:hypothetical protein
VEVDERWDPLYPCALFEATWDQNRSEGQLALGRDIDFTGHQVESIHVRLEGRSIFLREGTYHVAEHLREGEDYGFYVKGQLEPEADGWVGELVYEDGGRWGMRDVRWQGTRRLAIRRQPWPASFGGTLWPGLPEE